MTRIAVCAAQVPFVRGGAEHLVRGLVAELGRRGHAAECVSLPFKWYPKEELLAQAAAWRLIDLSEANGARIDLVVATKFPTYFVRHPNKVTWLLHQYRAIYDLVGTPYSEFTHEPADVRLRDRLIALDTDVLGESRRLFTIARNVSARLARYNGLAAEALYHPPPLADRLRPTAPGDYVLSVGRLEANKRVDLAIEAVAHAPSTRLIVAGEGPRREDLERQAAALGVERRVAFAGGVDDPTLADLYAGARAVVFAPFDEDYGYVTLEAFLAGKPVVTTRDAGGPLEFVRDGVTGLVTDPTGEALGAALERLAGDRASAARLGEAGDACARAITWDGAIDRLLS